MLDAIGKVFAKRRINKDEILKYCSLKEMVFLKFGFCPWRGMITPEYKTIKVKGVDIFDDRVFVRFDGENFAGSYVGSISSHCSCWGGVFNTKEAAEQCFKDTMAKWKANIP